MYRTEVVVQKNALANLEALIEAYPELVEDTAETVFRTRIEPPLRYDLEYEPGPVARPIQWTSERQRRAYFATNGFGFGIPYRRQGRVSKAWKFSVVRDERGIAIRVENTNPRAKYVIGQLRARGRDPQQKFHKNTGWKNQGPTVAFYAQAMQEETIKELTRLLRGK